MWAPAPPRAYVPVPWPCQRPPVAVQSTAAGCLIEPCRAPTVCATSDARPPSASPDQRWCRGEILPRSPRCNTSARAQIFGGTDQMLGNSGAVRCNSARKSAECKAGESWHGCCVGQGEKPLGFRPVRSSMRSGGWSESGDPSGEQRTGTRRDKSPGGSEHGGVQPRWDFPQRLHSSFHDAPAGTTRPVVLMGPRLEPLPGRPGTGWRQVRGQARRSL